MTDERIQNSQKDEPPQIKITKQIIPSYYFIITNKNFIYEENPNNRIGIFCNDVMRTESKHQFCIK